MTTSWKEQRFTMSDLNPDDHDATHDYVTSIEYTFLSGTIQFARINTQLSVTGRLQSMSIHGKLSRRAHYMIPKDHTVADAKALVELWFKEWLEKAQLGMKP